MESADEVPQGGTHPIHRRLQFPRQTPGGPEERVRSRSSAEPGRVASKELRQRAARLLQAERDFATSLLIARNVGRHVPAKRSNRRNCRKEAGQVSVADSPSLGQPERRRNHSESQLEEASRGEHEPELHDPRDRDEHPEWIQAERALRLEPERCHMRDFELILLDTDFYGIKLWLWRGRL